MLHTQIETIMSGSPVKTNYILLNTFLHITNIYILLGGGREKGDKIETFFSYPLLLCTSHRQK